MKKIFKKLFPSKHQKDIKDLQPLVDKINSIYNSYSSLSDNELRNKTVEFKEKIKNKYKDINDKIEQLNAEIDNLAKENKIAEQENKFFELNKLKDQKKEKIEETLNQILPEAFAVIKETARRLTENKQLKVKATDWDKKIASEKNNVQIDGDYAIWTNTWNVRGTEVAWNMIHYDVQLIGGIVLHQGKIAEMATGEGKTLVATLPVYLNAISGEGVHMITVNDYLAKRDAEWNMPLFNFHFLSVDCIDYHQPNTAERKNAYNADITYGTNNEFGFDYLRDNMAWEVDGLVQRSHNYSIIDEVDSVLIDEARTPLIISGPIPKGDQHEYTALKPRIEKLVRAQMDIIKRALNDAKRLLKEDAKESRTKGGYELFRCFRGLPKYKPLIKFLGEQGMQTTLQKTEAYYMLDNSKNMHLVDETLYFTIDEKNNQIELTDKGRELITEGGEDPELFVLPDITAIASQIEGDSALSPEEKVAKKEEFYRGYSEKSERLHSINQLLKAYTLFEIDVEYIVQDNKVLIVDEQTGRAMSGRRYSDGLHQAIEAKENVKVESATQTYATVTLQNYFRMYDKLAGMTGTAETEEAEFYEIYKMDVVVIPTNRPIARLDENDKVYKTKREKYNAIIEEIQHYVKQNRPVLVGTTSVEVSEVISRMLKMRKIPHQVLNAKYHQRESEVVSLAGQAGNVTIATNMAGRGTDIKLGDGVKGSGGLAIIASERHESRRIDRQLRGRAGRQGDPGSSQFFVSLEDDLMRLFGSERISKVMDKMGAKEGEVLQFSMLTKQIESAQRKVEENNFGIRKRLLEYDDVMNSQREVIYTRRRNALYGDKLNIDIDNMLFDYCSSVIAHFQGHSEAEDLNLEIIKHLAFNPDIKNEDLSLSEDQLIDMLYSRAKTYYKNKCSRIATITHQGFINIKNEQAQVKYVEINFTDGQKSIQMVVESDKTIETEGYHIIKELEKRSVLSLIDDFWKEHLREMDDLKQSVQNARFEQKDPILIYKFEAFELFQKMLSDLNGATLSMIFKTELDVSEATTPTDTPPPKKKKIRSTVNKESSSGNVNRKVKRGVIKKKKK